ncbi:MAG: YciI family protein [Mesorhizobium sp.]
MFYAILAYHVEGTITRLTPEEDAALMEHLIKINQRLESEGKLGPVARLDFTQSAVTVRGDAGTPVIDGPFAETKEQLLGLYIVNCASRDEAVAIAQEFKTVNKSATYEIRPVSYFAPGVALPAK